MAEVPIKGTLRSAHRNSANKAFAETLSGDANFAQGMNKLLDADVLKHMQSGKNYVGHPSLYCPSQIIERIDFVEVFLI